MKGGGSAVLSNWGVIGPTPLLLLGGLSLLAWALLLRRRRLARTPSPHTPSPHTSSPHPPGRHRRRRLWPAAPLVLAVLLSTTTAAAAVNDDFAYLPRLGDVAGLATGSGPWPTVTQAGLTPTALAAPGAATAHPRGAVLTLPLPDDGTGLGATSALVWLPPQYFTQPTARFPTLYLLHGSPGVPADWLRGGRVADTGYDLAAGGRPVIVVIPRVSRGWLDDPECVDGTRERVETHLFATVLPTVDAELRTVRDRSARILGGMSAGGYCALNLGLKHRDRIATILDLSGLTGPTHAGGLGALYGPDRGGATQARAAADTPRAYAPSLPADPPTRVWLDVGNGDRAVRPGLEAIAPVLRSRGVTTQLHVRPGEHTFHVWRPALAESLRWALTPAQR